MAGPPNVNGPGFGGGPNPGSPPQLPAPPQPSLEDIERVVGKAAGGSVNANASLLEAIRESSRVVASKLDVVNAELKGFRKDFNLTRKDLDPLVKYYQKKAQKWATLEEQFFREGMKLILKLQGASPPPSESSYEKTKYSPESSYGSSSSSRPRDSSGRYASSSSDKESEPVTKAAQREALWKTWTEETQKWMNGFKTASMYVNTPIKLLDAAVSRIGGGISMFFRGREEEAQKKAKEAQKAQQQAEDEAEELHQKQMKEVEEGEKFDKFFDRLRGTLDEVLSKKNENLPAAIVPATMTVQSLLVSTMVIGTLAIGSLIIASMSDTKPRQGEEPMRDVTPVGGEGSVGMLDYQSRALVPTDRSPWMYAMPQMVAMAARGRRNDEEIDWDNMRNVTPGAPEPRYGPIAGLLTGPSIEGYSPAGLISGPSGGPSGLFSGNDAQQKMADTNSDIWEPYLGEMSRFFSAPENTEVGRFLTRLLAGTVGQEGGAGKDKKNTLRIELPLMVQLGILALGIGVALIGAALLVLAVAVAAVLPVLVKAFLPVLHAIGTALNAVADFLKGFLLNVLLPFLDRTLQSVSRIIEGLADAVISFLNDPGAFIGKLVFGIVDGIGKGIKSLIDSLSQAIGDAFNNIPILSDISKMLGSIFRSVGDNISKVVSAAGTAASSAISGLSNIFSGMLGGIQGLLAIIGGGVALGISMLVATMVGLKDWFLAGGFLKPFGGATDAFKAGYAETMGSQAAMMTAVGSQIGDKISKATVLGSAAMIQVEGEKTNRVAAQKGYDRAHEIMTKSFAETTPTQPSQTYNTVNQSYPAFSGLPFPSGAF